MIRSVLVLHNRPHGLRRIDVMALKRAFYPIFLAFALSCPFVMYLKIYFERFNGLSGVKIDVNVITMTEVKIV
jgi:hypothetical protein